MKRREHLKQAALTVRDRINEYISERYLPDGGYFFARVLPSSYMDTYFAVKSLAAIGLKPPNPQATIDFYLSNLADELFNDIVGLFTATEVISELGIIPKVVKKVVTSHILPLYNANGSFGQTRKLYIEVPSELQNTYRAVKSLLTTGANFPKNNIQNFVLRMCNKDGGFGRGGSTLVSTYYAVEILKMLGKENSIPVTTTGYLRRKESEKLQYIESLFWLEESLSCMHLPPNNTGNIIDFVLSCQRSNGGFSRASEMGIATLEYTYYGLKILLNAGFFS